MDGRRGGRWAILVAVAVLGVPLLLCVGAARLGLGPFADDFGVVVTQHEPQEVQVSTADPAHLNVGVAWSEDGYCSGQFSLSVTETPTEIRLSTVTSRAHPGGTCAGLGTERGMAWSSVQLGGPLADRAVVRDTDGARLPVYDEFRQPVIPSSTA
ncbi:hypothetical protein [Catellatospora sichuanensis]|uniref:hypothetical protein n=1 Tax=Catellatospora sichuanensis TaxID=1969805 RepID=UPI001183AF28|nr:hypothetical protein [Catellatospora sichuanensis]